MSGLGTELDSDVTAAGTEHAAVGTELACGCQVVHEGPVRRARDAAMDPGALEGVSELFKVLSDPTRLRLLHALSVGELCVCDLSAVLSMTQSATSHQLAILRRSRLVRARRDGKTVYYTLDDAHVGAVLRVAMDHVGERGAKP